MRSRRGRLVLVAACGAIALSTAACSLPAGLRSADTARVADTASLPVEEIPEDQLAPPATSLTQPAGDPSAVPAPAATAAGQDDNSTWPTKSGPLSALDRDLIKKVRLATLWEMTIAQEAIQRGNSAKVRTISKEIAAQHHELDKGARDLAEKFGIRLPVKPTEAQAGWMADITGRTGRDYDATFVKWLRLAHGQIFPVIGSVRGTTQNTLVRKYAEECNAAVLNHQRLLESTGLAGPDAFPTPPPV
ncbi:DUF4142 domain-containing protein [Nonomuraea sp. ZG12]|uniref:DUF4142 domain-containing protein n=1 Tax=Nonomuraea sp. ZG12 TaxID=3452207 RepID=UPI003F8C9A7B